MGQLLSFHGVPPVRPHQAVRSGTCSTATANSTSGRKWIQPPRPLEMNGRQFKDYNFNQLRLFAEGLSCLSKRALARRRLS